MTTTGTTTAAPVTTTTRALPLALAAEALRRAAAAETRPPIDPAASDTGHGVPLPSLTRDEEIPKHAAIPDTGGEP
jgi:hypothetical protein